MNELSLFTGAGGGLLGSLLLGWRTIGYVEKDDYCQRIIRQRIDDGILHNAPIFGDIKTFISDGYADQYNGMVDVITAGFPCQPFSVAGKRKGELDDRNGWPYTIETIRRVRPRCCLLENVPGLLAHKYYGRILGDLAESGYGVRWKCISAGELGAPHKRDRLWILAYAKCPGGQGGRIPGRNVIETLARGPSNTLITGGENMADTKQPGLEERQKPEIERGDIWHKGSAVAASRIVWWGADPADVGDSDEKTRGTERPTGETIYRPETIKRPGRSGSNGTERPTQPRLGRVAHGVADRVDRLRAIGNGQVPIVAATAWEILNEEQEK